MRISEVVKETGVSRELIHHYLRQGLLPQPRQRAIYTNQQIDLLRLLKKLREDHQLPLDLIRRVFELFEFDLVAFIFGDMSLLTRVLYTLVGMAGVYWLTMLNQVAKRRI